MKKLLFIITKAETGGAQKVVYSLIKSLYNEYEITLIHGQGKDLLDWIKDFNIKTVYIKELKRELNLKDDLISLKKIHKIIKHNQFDIVHCHSAKAAALGRVAAKFCNIKKIVYTVHGWGSSINPYQSKLKTFILGLSEFVLSFLCTDIVCVSKADKQMSKKLLINQKKVKTIYNGIKCESNLKTESKNNCLMIGTVARIAPPKDWKNTVKLIKSLKEHNLDFKFYWVGDGVEYSKLKRQTTKQHLEDCFILLGNRSDVNKILDELNLFLLLTNWEGLPISIIEAMHKSLPIIASDVGGNSELVLNNKNGYLIKDNSNIEHIANKIINLSNNSELIARFGAYSLNLAQKYFSEDSMVDSYREVYEK